MNGIHEVSGSIPLSSTSFLNKINEKNYGTFLANAAIVPGDTSGDTKFRMMRDP